jgi:hypothetical protein
MDEFSQGLIAMNGFRTTAQDGGIAGLDAEAGSIYRHIGTRLINDADHTEWHTHFADLDTARTEFEIAHFTDRISEVSDLPETLGSVLAAAMAREA